MLKLFSVLWGSLWLFVMTISHAYAADLNLLIETQSTGGIAGPLNSVGGPYCPSAATPGCDISAADNRIRTHDFIRYRLSAQIGPPGDDVTVRVTFKPGLVIDEIPGGCDPFLSSASGDGSAGSPATLICGLGNQSSAALDIFLDARVIGTTPNGMEVGVGKAVIEGPASPTNTAPEIKDIEVTASPRIDIHKRLHSQVVSTRSGVLGVDMGYQVWVGLLDNTGVDPLLGNELVTGDITFVEDLTTISPNAYVYQCNTVQNSSVLPIPTFDPLRPDQSVFEAGSLSCDNIGTSATGSVTATISGADLSFEHIPTLTLGGTTIESRVPDFKAASYGVIRVFVPLADIDAAGGSLATVNRYRNLDLRSITNQSNFNGSGEDESNNTHALTLTNRGGAFSHTLRCYHPNLPAPSFCPGLWTGPPTNASILGSGDGLVEPSQSFATYTFYRNRTFFPDSYADVCAVFDDRFYEVEKYNSDDAARCHGTCGTRDTDYVIEYGTGYVDSSFRDAVTVPAQAVPDECRAADSNWHDSFDAASAVGAITKIRMRRLTPGDAGAVFAFSTQLRALDAASIPSVPNGTLYKTWGTYQSEIGSANYRTCDYVSGTSSTAHNRDSCGDRLILSRSTARIEKTTLPSDAANFIPAGGDVTFRLSPTFDSLGGSITDNVFIVDTIPAGAEYVLGSAVQSGAPFEPAVTGTVSSGQTLTWDLGARTVNVAIDPIDFRMRTASSTPAGTVFTNTVRIDAVSDISSVALRSDTRSVTVSSPAGLVMGKTVSVGDVPADTPIVFAVDYFNGTNSDFGLIDVIDILPYNGDGRVPVTSFSGTVALGSLRTESSKAQFYVSADASNSFNPDPQATSNDLSTGSTLWCPMTALHQINPAAVPTIGGTSSQCPQTGLDVKALRLIDKDPLPGTSSRKFQVELVLDGNAANDRYSNAALGTSDGVTLSAFSPIASTAVMGFGEMEADKVVSTWDPLNQGLYMVPGNEVAYTISARNIGTGPIDSGSIFLVDTLPVEVEFWNGDIDAGGPDNFTTFSSVGFSQSSGTGIIFNPSSDLGFSTAPTQPTSFTECTVMPLDGLFRPDILHLCFKPQGALNSGDPDPEIAFTFRARIK